jgi:shikimate dehydrogenase
MNIYGLIGFPLTHSFSKKYFTEKFQKEGITHSEYQLFEMENVTQELPSLIEKTQGLKGLNVTIPHKKNVIPFMKRLDNSAKNVGAVNVIKIDKNGDLVGYNSDYYGFKKSLENFLTTPITQALILGTGGASLAVKAALDTMGIEYVFVSRNPDNAPENLQESCIAYTDLSEETMEAYSLIINTTPVGTYPKVNDAPAIPYQFLTEAHYLYDLVYNPEITQFMQNGLAKGAKVKNGLEMLQLQAEEAWQIWNN